MKRWLFLLFLGGAGALGVRFYIFEAIYIASPSMEPTLPTGTKYFVNKLALKFRNPRRKEIVVFKTSQGPDKGLVKRVMAVGGDVIEIRQKKVYVNGEKWDEPYVQHVRPNEILLGDNIPPTEVPEGYVFVMGDNRDVSNDSRDFGLKEKGEWDPFVSIKDLKGTLLGVKEKN